MSVRAHHVRRRGRSGGFTLIEMLVAATLVAMVAATLFSGVWIVFRARDRAAATMETTRTAEIIFAQLRIDLENMLPSRNYAVQVIGDFTASSYLDDRGREADTFLLFTTADGPQHVSGDGEVRRVEYLVLAPNGAEGEHMLVRRVIHNLLSPPDRTPSPDDEILCRRIGTFAVQYTDGVDYFESWDSQQQGGLPAAVIVTIKLDPINGPFNLDPAQLQTFQRVFQIPAGRRKVSSGLGGR